MQAGGSLILSTRLKDGMTTDSTGQPVPWWFDIYLRKESQRAEEFRIFTVNKSVKADGSLLSPTGGVKRMYPAPHIHEHFTIHKWLLNQPQVRWWIRGNTKIGPVLEVNLTARRTGQVEL